MTELFQPVPPGSQPLQEVEGLRNQVVSLACRIHEELGGPIHEVIVSFGRERLTKQDIRPVADQLAQLVLGSIVPVNSWIEVCRDRHNLRLFPKGVRRISIARFDFMDRRAWTAASGGFVPACTANQLQAAIDKKAKRLAAYRERCDEAWLLLVADGFGISRMLGAPTPTDQQTVTSPFDRTYWFENFSRSIVELSVRG